MNLPDEIWARVWDWVQLRALSHVCQRLWGLLQRRAHAEYWVTDSNAMRVAYALARPGGSAGLAHHTVALRGAGMGLVGAQALATLRTSQTLRSLTLHLAGCFVGPQGARVLGTLAAGGRLETLCLYLRRNSVSDEGAVALAALGAGPALQVLTLDLTDNGLTDIGVRALAAALCGHAALQTLELALGHNSLGHDSACALVPLCNDPRLRRLALDLRGNIRLAAKAPESTGAADAIAALRHSPPRLTVWLP